MNFLTIFKGRSLSGLLCLVCSILTFIVLQLDAITDQALNPLIVIVIASVSLAMFVIRQQNIFLILICFIALLLAAWSVINLIHSLNIETTMGSEVWLFVSALWFLTWYNLVKLSAIKAKNKFMELFLTVVIPLIFGSWIFFLWEVLTIG